MTITTPTQMQDYEPLTIVSYGSGQLAPAGCPLFLRRGTASAAEDNIGYLFDDSFVGGLPGMFLGLSTTPCVPASQVQVARSGSTIPSVVGPSSTIQRGVAVTVDPLAVPPNSALMERSSEASSLDEPVLGLALNRGAPGEQILVQTVPDFLASAIGGTGLGFTFALANLGITERRIIKWTGVLVDICGGGPLDPYAGVALENSPGATTIPFASWGATTDIDAGAAAVTRGALITGGVGGVGVPVPPATPPPFAIIGVAVSDCPPFGIFRCVLQRSQNT